MHQYLQALFVVFVMPSTPAYGEAQQDEARGLHAASRRPRRQKNKTPMPARLKHPVNPGGITPGFRIPAGPSTELLLATANPAGPCGFRTPAELDASIQNGAANPAAAAEAARRWG